MTTTVLTTQKGSGDLVLKNRVRQVVAWEIEILSDGSFGKGSIRGDGKHLATAAKDGCANLILGADITAAIAIDTCNDDRSEFTVLLISSNPQLFPAQTVQLSSSIIDKKLCSIDFGNAENEHLLVTVPMAVIGDYLPTLQKLVSAALSVSRDRTLIRSPRTWKAGALAMRDLVCVMFDDDVPVGLVPDDARELAAELVEFADKVESRHKIAH